MNKFINRQSELKFLTNLGEREGVGAVISVIRTHLYGVDESDAGDPSYGRKQIDGRGHAPWVTTEKGNSGNILSNVK